MEKFIIFDTLLLFLRSKIILSMYKEGMSYFNFFKLSNREFIITVLPILKNNIIAKNDILVTLRGIIEEIYLVNSGTMS